MTAPIVPPDLDSVQRVLRTSMADIPSILADWPHGDGPLADVPLLDPGHVAPRAFSELAGTVRVATVGPSLVTVAGVLEIGGSGGLLVTTIALSAHDLAEGADTERARAALAAEGAHTDGVPVEVVALLSPIDPDGGPVGGVGIVRPLVVAHPTAFPHPEDQTDYDPDLVRAAHDAGADDRELVSDLGGHPLHPLPADLGRIWSAMFAVGRTATVGLAARSASR
ncbi:MAG TPA: hypothetical protein VMM13_18205 [Euzebya sp.]|nr:hypothetical protein [Euzebya sp.]